MLAYGIASAVVVVGLTLWAMYRDRNRIDPPAGKPW